MIDIFIKSYYKDFKMLNYCLKSIEKYLTGYNKIVVVIPKKDYQIYQSIVHTDLPIELHVVEEYGDGYLYQQFIKMTAYKYCDSQFIMYVDSDCIFDKHINIENLVSNGQSEILYTHYSKVDEAICWKQCTERFMNDVVEFEFMRRLPLIYHRETLETIHNLEPNLESVVMNSGRFSEFNALGAWAFVHQKDKYSFVNTDNWKPVDPLGVQLWSHCTKNQTPLEKLEYKKAIDTINKVLELNITEL
jgi:hypothetical protein